MKFNERELRWHVFYHSPSEDGIRPWNIFNHASFREDVVKHLKDKKLDDRSFAEEVKRDLLYYFWCKSEYEIVLSQWVGRECEVKVDIYTQVYMNFEHFINYLSQFRTKGKKENI